MQAQSTPTLAQLKAKEERLWVAIKAAEATYVAAKLAQSQSTGLIYEAERKITAEWMEVRQAIKAAEEDARVREAVAAALAAHLANAETPEEPRTFPSCGCDVEIDSDTGHCPSCGEPCDAQLEEVA